VTNDNDNQQTKENMKMTKEQYDFVMKQLAIASVKIDINQFDDFQKAKDLIFDAIYQDEFYEGSK
jgi:hypothetical protein